MEAVDESATGSVNLFSASSSRYSTVFPAADVRDPGSPTRIEPR
jgi:hypothetical protein